MVHILKVVSRHGSLFYPYREIFINAMINLIPKYASSVLLLSHLSYYRVRVALLPQSAPEQRLFALDLVDLMIKWEQTRKEKLEDLKKGSIKTNDGDDMDVVTTVPVPGPTSPATPGMVCVRVKLVFILTAQSIPDGARYTRCHSLRWSR